MGFGNLNFRLIILRRPYRAVAQRAAEVAERRAVFDANNKS